VRPEGVCQRKIPMTPSEIEPANFRIVVQCLNQLFQRVPTKNIGVLPKKYFKLLHLLATAAAAADKAMNNSNNNSSSSNNNCNKRHHVDLYETRRAEAIKLYS
jgi:hypothetical protein